MPAFLLSKRGSDDLETIVFKLDNEQSEDEGIPVFTTQQYARDWMAGSDFESEYDVVSVDDLPFMFWCVEICKEGIGYLILDPDRTTQVAGEGQNTIDIASHLGWAAAELLSTHQRTSPMN